jgi:hypothetical protein
MNEKSSLFSTFQSPPAHFRENLSTTPPAAAKTRNIHEGVNEERREEREREREIDR